MKKFLIFVSLLFIVTGCSNGQFMPNYDKMQISDEGINGYYLDLRVYGELNNDIIKKTIKIDNYNNKEYGIVYMDSNITDAEGSIVEDKYYLLNDTAYVLNAEGEYVEDNNDVKYNNTNIYLEGIKKVADISEPKEETIGLSTYDVYEVTFAKRNVQEIIDYLEINNLELSDDVKGQIYLDKDEYVHKIIYNIEDLEIIASYYLIDKATEIKLQTENGI
ncbi:MAG: hypothetical protein PHD78_02230 [Bacilli bacterium]|nr:hypothetical protein [Bacilli bacterium]MDD4053748.1 hypothetical protein [Bacilli bacterium]